MYKEFCHDDIGNEYLKKKYNTEKSEEKLRILGRFYEIYTKMSPRLDNIEEFKLITK